MITFTNISYRRLLKDGKNGTLKPNLFEHFDFEVVCNEVWQHLYSWYSADWCLPRKLVADRVNGNKIMLDLYAGKIVPLMPELDFETESQEEKDAK